MSLVSMVTVVFLSKFVNKLLSLDRGDLVERRKSPPEALLLRFTNDELATLGRCFSVLDRKLQYDDGPHQELLFQGGPSTYRYYEMPENFGPDEFVASWNGV